MTEPAIRVQNISKQYQIGLRETANQTFREAITSTLTAPFRRFKKFAGGKTSESDHFMALNDVSFEVQPGEVVGIIGRNGAGKSTLLKILSRITEPTSGRIELNGRVASLLEVGTGFHPELTGRENVYLNGAILGMSKAEIKNRFDEIVSFSEVETFLDTPVKKYSSGMKVRLAFSVAAHLDPEILIIDEVLAVGDHAFQEKCLGRMSGVAKSGRTILFVSHNMAAMARLCSSALLLNDGKATLRGSVNEVADLYLTQSEGAAVQPISDRKNRQGNGRARLCSVKLLNGLNGSPDIVPMYYDWLLKIEFDCLNRLVDPHVGIIVTTPQGQRVTKLHTADSNFYMQSSSERVTVTCLIRNVNLVPGRYHIGVGIADGLVELTDHVDNAAVVTVIPRDVNGTGRVPDQYSSTCHYHCDWSVDESTKRRKSDQLSVLDSFGSL